MDLQKEFIEKIINSGIVVVSHQLKLLKLIKRLNFQMGERFISIDPSYFKLRYRL
jgi:hypothetical protein